MKLDEMDGIRVLIANEPRLYREVIAAALHVLRPRAVVVVVEPAELAADAARFQPTVVFCSRREDVAATSPIAWVLFPLDDRCPVIVNIAGDETSIPTPEFHDLLSVVDATARLTSGASSE